MFFIQSDLSKINLIDFYQMTIVINYRVIIINTIYSNILFLNSFLKLKIKIINY